MSKLAEQVQEAVTSLRNLDSRHPEVGVILGSGLQRLTDAVAEANRIPYHSIPGFPKAAVDGHAGELVIGSLGGKSVIILSGRSHYYEGHHPIRITFPVRVLRGIGCHTLVVTNAAGGLNPLFRVGDLMLIDDHINLVGLGGANPLRGLHDTELGPQFVDMGEAYDAELRRLALDIATKTRQSLQHGVYVMVAGPSYETPAELRFLRAAGADAVGMSTAAEVVVARQCGMRVLGISCIANSATGKRHENLSHQDVLAAMDTAGTNVARLVNALLEVM